MRKRIWAAVLACMMVLGCACAQAETIEDIFTDALSMQTMEAVTDTQLALAAVGAAAMKRRAA